MLCSAVSCNAHYGQQSALEEFLFYFIFFLFNYFIFLKLQDAVSRKISLDTLVDFALAQGSQWIFITPHDIRYQHVLLMI